jgi:hypothetical protein
VIMTRAETTGFSSSSIDSGVNHGTVGHSDPELPHGHSLGGIDQLARAFAQRLRSSRWKCLSIDDRYELALSAMVELLYVSQTPPDQAALSRAARRAMAREIAERSGIWGMRLDDQDDDGPCPLPGHAVYWGQWCLSVPAADEQVVDELAVRQIWSRIEYEYRIALWALAHYGEVSIASAAIARPRALVTARLWRGRTQIRRWWYDHEQGARMRVSTRRHQGTWSGSSASANSGPASSVWGDAVRRHIEVLTWADIDSVLASLTFTPGPGRTLRPRRSRQPGCRGGGSFCADCWGGSRG